MRITILLANYNTKQVIYKFSFYQKSIVFSYGTSHLENFSNRMYYEDTKKE